MTLRADVLVGILCMALVTYVVRAGGFAALRSFRPPRFVERMLLHLPGSIFIAFILPGAAAHGLPGLAAAVAAAVAMRLSGRLTLSILLAVAALWGMKGG